MLTTWRDLAQSKENFDLIFLAVLRGEDSALPYLEQMTSLPHLELHRKAKAKKVLARYRASQGENYFPKPDYDEQIHRDVNTFLSQGGQITHLPPVWARVEKAPKAQGSE